jgi:hypothetical protein
MLSTSDSLLIAFEYFEYYEFATQAFPHIMCNCAFLCIIIMNSLVVDRGAPDLEFSNLAGTGFTGFGQKFRLDLR